VARVKSSAKRAARGPDSRRLDITAAFVVYGFFGVKPLRLLQRIASGLLGSRAFKGGFATALLGLLCHFAVAFWGSGCLFRVEPRCALHGTARSGFRGAVRRGRLLFHESHCGAALGYRQAAVFFQDDDRRVGDTHLLRRTSHISYGAPIFRMTFRAKAAAVGSATQFVCQS
jgi:hypothetical protein